MRRYRSPRKVLVLLAETAADRNRRDGHDSPRPGWAARSRIGASARMLHMDLEEILAGMRALCVEHLGEDVGAQLSEMAMRGVGLRPVGDGEAATGQCQLGGPALLDPGTSWPQYGGFPLSLLAILDADSLAGWVDELPAGAGLLNVFFLRPDAGYKEDYDRYLKEVDLGDLWGSTRGRVIRADPQRAVEVPAP